MSFSLKSLFVCITVVAVAITAYPQLKAQYYSRELNRLIEIGDGCSILEHIDDAKREDILSGWADRAIVKAARNGDYLNLRRFSYKLDLNRRVDGDNTPLMLAAAHGRFNAAKFLLVNKVDPNIRNNNGETALDIALSTGHPEIAALIAMAHGVDWETVVSLEAAIWFLQFDLRHGWDTEEVLQSVKSSGLHDLHIDIPLIGVETAWFQINDRLRIGTSSSDFGFVWIIDGVRVDEVEYFYPPDSN